MNISLDLYCKLNFSYLCYSFVFEKSLAVPVLNRRVTCSHKKKSILIACTTLGSSMKQSFSAHHYCVSQEATILKMWQKSFLIMLKSYTTGTSYLWVFFSGPSLGILFFWFLIIAKSTQKHKLKKFSGFRTTWLHMKLLRN